MALAAEYTAGFQQNCRARSAAPGGFAETVERRELSEKDWETLYSSLQSLMAELAQGGSPAYYPLEDDFAAYRLTGKEAVNHADTDRLLREVLGQKAPHSTPTCLLTR